MQYFVIESKPYEKTVMQLALIRAFILCTVNRQGLLEQEVDTIHVKNVR